MTAETDPTTAGMTDAEAAVKARQIIADFATSYRDTTPVPTVGTTPPVPQPGRPPMSQKATDASALMLSGGLASLPIGAATSLVLWASGHADPAVIAVICAAPTTLILALSRLVKRAKEAMPDEIHNHYTGPVYQDLSETRTENKGVWVKTNNRPAA